MKATRFFMMFVAVAAMMFASCDKDGNTPAENDNLAQTEEMIIGSWNEKEALYILSQGGTCDTTSMLEEGESIEMTFRADMTFTSIYHSTDGDSEDNGTWAVNGNTLTLTTEFGPMNYNIDQLDASVFNITYNEKGEDEDGQYSLIIAIKMTKK